MPIRTALLQLENEGLVILEPHKKAIATSFSPKEVHQFCEIRTEMEALSIRYVIDNIKEREIKDLYEMINIMEECSATEYLDYNRDFHDELNQINGNKTLTNIILQLRNNVDRYLKLYVSSGDTTEKINKGNEDHRKILDAVKEKNSFKAENLIKEHLTRTCRDVEKILEGKMKLKNTK